QNNEKEKQSYANKSDLIVSGVENKKLVEDIRSYNIYNITDNIIKNSKMPILKRIERINNLEVGSDLVQEKTNTNGLVEIPKANFLTSTPYIFSEEEIEVITEFSKSENINLKTTFFHVGNLKTSANLSYMGGLGGSKYLLSGSDQEKEKQKEIKNLVFEIYAYLDWITYLEQFKQLKFVRLALSNQGTIFENDITLTLKFPSNVYMKSEELLPPGPSIIEEILDTEFIPNIFGDINSVEINSYRYPIGATLPRYQLPSFPGYDNTPKYNDLKEDYFKEHKKIECYNEYEENGYIVQKYHFEELKQYTSISFPSVLLFNYDNVCVEIEYEIISRSNPHKKQKVVKVN
ncbi:hypothetical protein, partial [Enterococcus sp. RIT-PI-f]|uniref:hypothetical protein n=1 Tax=Enterococcus sp. RIT-PI-f TaxID=1690244 RepID=UPI0006B8D980